MVGTSAARKNTIVIANPLNGPNVKPNIVNDFNVCIDFLRDAGVEVIGYVKTKEGYPDISSYRDVQLVKEDIDLWSSASYTTIDGIFIYEVTDRWPNDSFDSAEQAILFYPTVVDYVLDIRLYNRAVLNPGNMYDENMTVKYRGDSRVITIVQESSQRKYMPTETSSQTCSDLLWCQPSNGCIPAEPFYTEGIWCRYVRDQDGIEPLKKLMDEGAIFPDQTAILIYGAVDDESITIHAVELGIANNVAWFWITSDSSPNPWDEPPTERIMNGLVKAIPDTIKGILK